MLLPGHSIDDLNARWGTVTLDAYAAADIYLLQVPAGHAEVDLVDSLDADPTVEDAELNYDQETPEGIRAMVISATGGSLVDFEDQSAMARVGLDGAHRLALGRGTIVAVLDSGVDPLHPALQNHLVPGFDFVEGDTDPTETANGVDDDQDGLIDEGFGHGTMVSALVALVAPEAMILPIRVLNDEGRSDVFTVSKAIRYAGLHGAKILNMSFGTYSELEFIEKQLRILEDAGIVVVAGAGNSNQGSPELFPGRASDVIMVTAVDSLDIKADFADFGEHVRVSAPGTGIRSAFPGGRWAIGSGCSFATPLVAGEAALIVSRYSNRDPDSIRDRIKTAVVPVDQLPGNQSYGNGLGLGRISLLQSVSDVSGATGTPGERPDLGKLFAEPNPSRGSVLFHIAFSGGSDGGVLGIFDSAGRRIRSMRAPGTTVFWDGLDEDGHKAPSGVYFARLTAGDENPGITRIVRLP